ncbi:Lcl C-terminal domain-containing protein [Vibrio cholerae]|uniref:Lcl C-terminal domain-containing protein n=1 Tax=Vibrio cholerae TaxID=666 RepID=UPI003966B302
MLTLNYHGGLAIALSALLLAANVQASSLCAGSENTAITATTPSADFSDNGDGTVTHHTTELIWQRCSLGQSWDGTDCTGEVTTYTWGDAFAAGAGSTLGGFSDWRLPNKNELASIVEYRCYQPAINNQQFPNTPSAMYWSSSPIARDRYYAWYVNFLSGYVSYGDKGYGPHGRYGRVRLVRDALEEPSGEPGIETINGTSENRK